MKIGTNITATIAATSLAKNERAMAQSMQRLSTGVKINSAADDAAGLAMVDRMTAQSKGLSQAVQNANDAIGMIQTADGAISGVTDMLQRMRELSVQAVSDTNTASDRQALDLEYQALKSEVTRIFSQTQWNGENLLDGSHFGATTSFQVGANVSQTIEMSLGAFSTATLGRTTNYGSHLSAAPASVEVSQPTSSYVTTNDTTGSWTQRGADIDGEAAGDESGWSTVMSNDGNTITISAPRNDGAGADSGHIRIFDWSGSSWVQRGLDIDGEAKTFTNGDFSSSSVSVNGNVASIDGWDIHLEQVKLGSLGATGPSTVAGYATPSDSTPNPTYGARISRGDQNAPNSASYNYSVNGSTLQMYSSTSVYGGDVLHGPYVVSKEPVYVAAGSDLSFEWRAQGGSDAFDVYAYALNTDTGETINLLNQTGSGTNDSGWQTVNVDIPTTGNYKFVFVSGTFDETFGTLAGASLYIDNVNVGAAPGALSYSQLLANLTEAGALTSIAMSEDGNTVSIADFGAESTAGQVRVYSWDGSAWIQKGADLVGEAPGDAVSSISMSGDGDTIVMGASYNDGNGTDAGHARVYDWNGSSWVQRSNDIDGQSAADYSGQSVSISDDGNTMALSSPGNNSNGNDSGHVRIFTWSGTAWIAVGNPIVGESAEDQINNVSISTDGETIAVGATGNDGNGADSGHVRVYNWNGTAWTQIGDDINGEAAGDMSGYSVALSDAGDTVAIGAPANDGSGSNAGHVRLYDWNGTAWVQRGADLDGEAIDDRSGSSVSINSIGSTVVVGAPNNDGNGADSGHSKVYDWPTTTALVHTAGVDVIDFNNRDLVEGDRITLTIAGGTEIQGVIGTDGLDALLTDMATQIAAQTGLFTAASAASGVLTISGLLDGSSPASIAVSLEQFEAVVTTAINTSSQATISLQVIDNALTQMNLQRSTYGATMNRLEYAIDNLSDMFTNTQSSRSRIEDADYAKESAELARTQIIQQAATAMVAQANQQTKIVMDILNWDK
ncbi:flagellin [Porticoccaceae bacterium]|nr:flagellin [Porticoccaceae bacterium]